MQITIGKFHEKFQQSGFPFTVYRVLCKYRRQYKLGISILAAVLIAYYAFLVKQEQRDGFSHFMFLLLILLLFHDITLAFMKIIFFFIVIGFFLVAFLIFFPILKAQNKDPVIIFFGTPEENHVPEVRERGSIDDMEQFSEFTVGEDESRQQNSRQDVKALFKLVLKGGKKKIKYSKNQEAKRRSRYENKQRLSLNSSIVGSQRAFSRGGYGSSGMSAAENDTVKSEQVSCPICYADFQENEEVIELKCSK